MRLDGQGSYGTESHTESKSASNETGSELYDTNQSQCRSCLFAYFYLSDEVKIRRNMKDTTQSEEKISCWGVWSGDL